MTPFPLVAALVIGLSSAAAADGFVPVTERESFLDLLDARELRHPIYGIRLLVTADGKISGDALGWPVTGTWDWKDGYFCREMDWSGTPIPFNCQLVEVTEDQRLRFTVDRGAGDAATFRLQ
ncbi:dihydrodipicolinate reductase [Stagnihabitans tardus]|uniref:Dihydrodipicolinate reductase n=1 Tax=Stagnihabitans tardus TaxID=2699202 RepID=A0AAE4Y5L3_9RHOB|nr:dihydrodipicolinate reductase [Stagnihabitans tardus]NBZ86142.1 dihydrodipicolinate reductase [Stagnihabitans tardus]